MIRLILLLLKFRNMAKISDVYSETAITDSGKYQQYVDTFGNVVQKDSLGKSFGFAQRILDMNCWDMDSIETAQHGSNDMTMDLVLGLEDFDDVRQVAATKYLLPVELKLNCVAFNLRATELTGKDEHTRQYDMGIRFGSNSVFLFTNRVVGQVKHVLDKNYLQFSISDFDKEYLNLALNDIAGLLR